MDVTPEEFLMQLGIVCVVFAAVSVIFSSKLFEVIQERQDKTVLLEKDAESRMEKANEVSEAYRAKIDIAYGEAQKKLKQKKDEIISVENKLFKEEEKKILAESEEERKKVIESVEGQRIAVLRQADELANSLVDRIIQ